METRKQIQAVGTIGKATRMCILSGLCALQAIAFQSMDHRGNCYGKPSKSGTTAIVENGTGIDITGHGTEYGHHCKEDQGRWVYQAMTGDFDVVVQVSALNNDEGSAAKAGLIVRTHATDMGAKYIGLMAISDVPHKKHNQGGFPDAFTFEARTKSGGTLKVGGFDYHPVTGSVKRNYPDVWMRLKRQGGAVRAFHGTDGNNWREIPSLGRLSNYKPFSVDLPQTAYVGVCVSSNPQGNPNLKSTAKFRNLRGFDGGPVTLKPVREIQSKSIVLMSLSRSKNNQRILVSNPGTDDAKFYNLLGQGLK